ncbi:MAG TPA: nucleoside triphosphate pyrophosphohydrolase [Chthoniobacterales bacterium]|nr:nucleoside triphosphate pyrophosphohydrolase [Chthoniobacterales bacterium]
MSSTDRLREIVAKLRAPDGCPWDREQTHATLKPHLLEECYELIDAIDDQDDEALLEELGDVLLQVVLHAQMASEEGRFDFDQIADRIADKLVLRHPHVFGDKKLSTSEAVLRQWDVIKRSEKQERASTLDGVPRTLPALAKAQKVQVKAARAGFDWPEAHDVVAKIREEISEIETAKDTGGLSEELGDLLFSIVNFARKRGLDAEDLLQTATAKFTRRFRTIETLAADRGIQLSTLSLPELDRFWEEVKQMES